MIKVTARMMQAARRAEVNFYRIMPADPGQYILTPDSVLKAMLQAAVATIPYAGDAKAGTLPAASMIKRRSVLLAPKPRRRGG
jgi:hypothetical protein